MLPTTLALYLATQMTLAPQPVTAPPLDIDCGTRAVWDAESQNCRALPPTREQCWSDGQQLDPRTKSCVPVTFSAYCREHNWNYEQEHTVSRILNDLNAHDCEEAEDILRKSRKLTLRSAGSLKVQDLRPLRALPFLEELNLNGHRVSDLSPLQKTPRLRKLSLRNNDVYDLEPLLSLPRLETLDLVGNPIDPNDPVLKKLKKRVKVTLHAPVETSAVETDDNNGFTVD
ncbi:leucine-rich repeat domain-containing protein [Oligoflexus tunisiensis]|uniref:leucine-rich repeat domain-containing protein n=1 Tax=Oligoflexus tunisiensis TaxID=708132 RepID=UPI00114C86DF|nr:leucine-rich repeat domain-containing protein [Oligoflexus tunisiensis]